MSLPKPTRRPSSRNAEGSHTRRQIEVRRGAVGHHDAITLHHIQFLARRPHAVSHDGGRLSEESVAVVGIAIARTLLLQVLHPGYLRRILRQMRLHRQLIRVSQPPTCHQQLRRTRRYEARRYDGAHQRVGLVKLGYQLLVARDGLLHVFAEVVGTVAVHGHLAYQCSHASFLIELHQQTRTLRMDGAEDARAHRAEEPLGMQEAAVHTLSIPHVGIFRLLGEGVLLQPRQQFQVHSHPWLCTCGAWTCISFIAGMSRQLPKSVTSAPSLSSADRSVETPVTRPFSTAI